MTADRKKAGTDGACQHSIAKRRAIMVAMMSDGEHLLKPAELGDVLRVSRKAVCRWAREGQIPRIALPDGRFVFDLAAVLATLSGETPPPGGVPSRRVVGGGSGEVGGGERAA